MIRQYQPLDYWELCGWWNHHGWTPPEQNMLPEVGYIVDDVCAGFLYKTDSKIAWLEFIISNPKSEKEQRDQALDLLIEQLYNRAKELGFQAIFTSASHQGLIERYKAHSFKEADLGMTNLVKRVG